MKIFKNDYGMINEHDQKLLDRASEASEYDHELFDLLSRRAQTDEARSKLRDLAHEAFMMSERLAFDY